MAVTHMRVLWLAFVTCALVPMPAWAAGACWRTPPSQTVEEIGHVVENQQRRMARRSGASAAPKPAVLALSGGRLKTAYGAGLLVGWGETGKRPDFSAVTAVGVSALIAPFAFLGAEGDQKIADIFSCEAANVQDMAERAASYIDAGTLEAIARRHDAGARLMVALPGSAARRETVWDIGALAASRHPKAQRYIRNILVAAVDLTTFIDPATMPLAAGALVERNTSFRQIGAGEPFLSARGAPAPDTATYLIHNGVLFPDEGEAYMAAARRTIAGAASPRADKPLVPAYDFFLAAEASRAAIYIASPRPHLNLQPTSDFDTSYLRALFLDAYREGRMSREWRLTFPDRNNSRYYGP
jgi:hypothetical protein